MQKIILCFWQNLRGYEGIRVGESVLQRVYKESYLNPLCFS